LTAANPRLRWGTRDVAKVFKSAEEAHRALSASLSRGERNVWLSEQAWDAEERSPR
jgi:hypothetical protein